MSNFFGGGFFGGGAGGGGGATTTAGPYASRPASGTATGDVYVSTDSPYTSIWNGSAWVVTGMGVGEITPPPTTGWTAAGTPSAPTPPTLSTVGGQLNVVGADPYGGSSALSIIYRASPTPPYSVTVFSTSIGGLSRWALFNSSTNAALSLLSDTRIVQYSAWTSVSGASVVKGYLPFDDNQQTLNFIRLRDDNTDLIIEVGQQPNGAFQELYRMGRTSGVFSGGAPTDISWAMTGSDRVVHYKES